MIRFHVLGTLDLQDADGRHLGSPLAGSKRLALLAYLTLAGRGGSHRRDTLLGLFWPEADQARARNALSNMLHQIRRTLGAGTLEAHGREGIGVARGSIWCDALAFQAAVGRGALAEGLELYRGDLLEGFHLTGGSPEFEYWLDGERERLRRGATEAARALTDRAEAAGDPGGAIHWARKACALDPFDEVAARRLMSLLDGTGDRAGALQTYQDFAARLGREFGAEPSAETRAVADGVRDRSEPLEAVQAWRPPSPLGAEAHPPAPAASRSAAAAATAGALDRAIAVLPFDNLSDTAEAEPFVVGLHDDLLTELSRISALTVIARTSVLRYQGTSRPAPEIARELGVRALIEGGVQTAGGRLRLNVQLIDAANGVQQWAERYDRELTTDNIFDLQAELAREIARALRAKLTPAERKRSGEQQTGDLEAYRLHAQGRRYLDQRTESGMRRSLDYFERATRLDPGYALAWVGLSDALMLLYTYEHEPGEDAIARAEDATRRALALDPTLAEARTSLGLLHSARREGSLAIHELQRAIQLRPGYAEAHNWLSWNLQILGQRDDALDSARKAVELDPMSPEAVSNLSLSLLTNRQLESALLEARHVLDLQPDWTTGALLEGLALYHLGRHADAVEALRGLSVEWAGSGAEATLALAWIAMGRHEQARDALVSIEEAGDSFSAGLVQLALGHRERGLAAIRSADWSAYWPVLSLHHFYPQVLAPLRAPPVYRELQAAAARAWGQR